jgi:hypothetical protein
MTHFELAVQISASKSKYIRELMRFKVSVFWSFYMKIEKALELSCFRQILIRFGLGLLVLVFKSALCLVGRAKLMGFELLRVKSKT